TAWVTKRRWRKHLWTASESSDDGLRSQAECGRGSHEVSRRAERSLECVCLATDRLGGLGGAVLPLRTGADLPVAGGPRTTGARTRLCGGGPASVPPAGGGRRRRFCG